MNKAILMSGISDIQCALARSQDFGRVTKVDSCGCE